MRDASGALLDGTGGGPCAHAPRSRSSGLRERPWATSGVLTSTRRPRCSCPSLAAHRVWAASGFIARRLSRPIHQLALVADEIGHGRLDSRIRIPRHHRQGEIRVLADALHDMAARIEKQLADQRALLATVSHEIRTPLARMRLLIELARGSEDGGDAPPARLDSLDEMDREIVGIDALVSDLLANSRLDFAAVKPVTLDAAEVAKQAVERAGLDPARLIVEGERLPFRGDPTLVARAVANLLENAERHAGSVTTFRVHRRGR